LVVLRADQEDMAEAWKAEGWRALVLDESLREIAGSDWTLAIAPLLDLNLQNKD
jgi:hypothetical protein